MIKALAAWNTRCDASLAQLNVEIKKVMADAEKRAKREAQMEKQVKAATEAAEKNLGAGAPQGNARGARGPGKRDQADEDDGEDLMDVDGSATMSAGGKKRIGGGGGGGVGGGGGGPAALLSRYRRTGGR